MQTKPSKAPQPSKSIAAPPTSKTAQVVALLIRDEGATLQQLIDATGWLPHSTRAALTGLKKKGYVVSSDKLEGARTYRAVAPE
jgi:DNA-binding MarR family transcriptional regulator